MPNSFLETNKSFGFLNSEASNLKGKVLNLEFLISLTPFYFF